MHRRWTYLLLVLILLGGVTLATLSQSAYADTGPTDKRIVPPVVTVVPSPSPTPAAIHFRLAEVACFSGAISLLFTVDAVAPDVNLLTEPWSTVKYSIDGLAHEADLSQGLPYHMEFLDYIPYTPQDTLKVEYAMLTLGSTQLWLENPGDHAIIPCPTHK